jgi:predicted metalloprotease with PDZ domain
MRQLYQDFYKPKNRGFTENELRATIEKVPGDTLEELFSYIYTKKEPDYKKYFSYAGLEINTNAEVVSGGYLGADIRKRNHSTFVSKVDWKSPAWHAGLRAGKVILNLDDQPVQELKSVMSNLKDGEKLTLTILKNKEPQMLEIVLGTKMGKDLI